MQHQNKTRGQLIDELNEMRRKVAELEAVQKSFNKKESQYIDIVDKTNDGIFVIQDGLIKFANEKAAEITGYSREEALASNAIAAFVHPDDQEMLAQYHARRLQGDESHYQYPFRYIHKDGTVGWVEMNSSLIMWEEKPAALCFMTGIAERKQAEQALNDSQDLLRVLVDSLPVGILYVDAAERIVFANKTAASWWGTPGSDLSGHAVEEIFGDHYLGVQSRVKTALA